MPRRTMPLHGDGPLVLFARSLRALQERTGGTVKMAQILGASRTAVYAALAGTRLPDLDTLDAMVTAWSPGESMERWRQERRRTEEALGEASRLRGEVIIARTLEDDEFHDRLSRIWNICGNPSRNEWGAAAGLSPRTVAAYLDGRTLPTKVNLNKLMEGLASLNAQDVDVVEAIYNAEAELAEEYLYRARQARQRARQRAAELVQAMPSQNTRPTRRYFTERATTERTGYSSSRDA